MTSFSFWGELPFYKFCLSPSVCLYFTFTHASIGVCCGVCKSMEQRVISLTGNDRSLWSCYVALVWDQPLTGTFKLIWSTGRSSSFQLSSYWLSPFMHMRSLVKMLATQIVNIAYHSFAYNCFKLVFFNPQRINIWTIK